MMQVEVKVVGALEFTKKLKVKSETARAKVLSVMEIAKQTVRNQVVRNLSGKYLNVVTGNLRNSTFGETEDRGSTIAAIIGTNAWYGKLWHNGWTRNTGKTSKTYAPRPYLSDALEMRKRGIVQQLLKAVREE